MEITLRAGREVDTLIGVHLFGLDRTKQYEIPHYSTNLLDAFLVVNKLRKDYDFWFELTPPESFSLEYKCRFQLDDMDESTVCKTAEEAICLTALKTLRICE